MPGHAPPGPSNVYTKQALQAKLDRVPCGLSLDWNQNLRKKAFENEKLPLDKRSRQGSFIWIHSKVIWDINPNRADAADAMKKNKPIKGFVWIAFALKLESSLDPQPKFSYWPHFSFFSSRTNVRGRMPKNPYIANSNGHERSFFAPWRIRMDSNGCENQQKS